MFKTLFTKTLYDKRWVIFGWSLGFMILSLFIVVLYPDFGQKDVSDQLKQLPEALQAIAGSFDFNTIPKYLDSQVFYNNLIIFASIFGIVFGLSMLAGEEDKGTLQVVLGTQVSRTRFYLEKFAVMVVTFVVITIACWVGLSLGLVWINESASALRIFQAFVNIFVFTLLFGTLTLATAAVTGRKSISITIPTITTVVMYIVYTFSISVKWLKGWEKVTWNYYYANPKVVINGTSYWSLAVLVICIVLFFGVGLYFFRKRDLNS